MHFCNSSNIFISLNFLEKIENTENIFSFINKPGRFGN